MRRCIALAYTLSVATAAVFEGTAVKSNGDFMFLGKFCFGIDQDVTDGVYPWVSFRASTEITGQVFVIFDDEDKSWPSVYGNTSLSCQDREKLSKRISSGEGDQHGWSILPTPAGQGPSKIMERIEVREKVRPRFWFACVLNCEGGGIDMNDYHLEFRNHDESQFGVEMVGLLPAYALFGVVYIIGQVVLVRSLRKYRQTNTLHPMLTVFVVCASCEFLAVVSMFVHLAIYSHDGIGSPVCVALHELLNDIFNLAFVLLLLLVAQGWTITFPSIQEKKAVLGIVAAIAVGSVVLFGFERVARDPASTSFSYDSAPGIILLLLRFCCAGYFCWALWSTYRIENRPDKQSFYVAFGACFGAWLVSTPTVVGVGLVLNPWVRFKCIEGILLACNTLAIGVMGFLLWPTRAEAYFQIGSYEFSPVGAAPYDDI